LPKNTLYITFDGLSDSLGQSQILPYLSGIAKNGYSITILSCEKKESLEREKNKIDSLLESRGISWRYVLYDEEGGFISRMKYLRELSLLAETEHAQKKFSLVHCRSYLAALIGLKFKRKYRVPFLFDMRGLWADERLEGNIWNRKNLVHLLAYYYFKSKEKQFFKEADAVVSLTHAAAHYLDNKFPDFKIGNKTAVIPCCVDINLFDPGKPGLQNVKKQDHLLVYSGSIGTWYYTKEMIDFVVEMNRSMPNVKLLIITRDIKPLDEILRAYPESERALVKTQSASYSQMPELLATAEASIFFIKPSFSKIASSPTKMAECWSMNLPIITNVGIGDNDLYFKEHKGGVLVNGFTREAYDDAIKQYNEIIKGPNDYRGLASQLFNYSYSIEIYTAVYKRLIVDAA
jgi:hypothetical protein